MLIIKDLHLICTIAKRIILLIVSCILTQVLHAQYAEWEYRKPIVVQERSGTNLAGYEILVELNTQILIEAGKMQSSGADIRFSNDCRGLEPLPLYLEQGINTDRTAIWVKMPNIQANEERLIYMFYGNPMANAVSNLEDVFDNPFILDGVTGSNDGIVGLDPRFSVIDGNDVSVLEGFDWVEIKGADTLFLGAAKKLQINGARKVKVGGVLHGKGAGYLSGTPSTTANDPITNGRGPGGGIGAGWDNQGTPSGGSYGGQGGTGAYAYTPDNATPKSNPYGDRVARSVLPGSGGGASDEIRGGNGGGALEIVSDHIEVTPTGKIDMTGGIPDSIYSLGAPGCCSGSGGGSGGGILIDAYNIQVENIISVRGGIGGAALASGGSGGGGRIKLFYQNRLELNGIVDTSGGDQGFSYYDDENDGFEPPPGYEDYEEPEAGDSGSLYTIKELVVKEPLITVLGEVLRKPLLNVSKETVCEGETVIFTSQHPLNPHQFFLNGVKVQEGELIDYSSSGLSNGDEVYVVSGMNECTDTSVSQQISVLAVPEVVVGADTGFCLNSTSVQLSANPEGGVWQGDGVSAGGLFDPMEAGEGVATLNYRYEAPNGCSNIDFQAIAVQTPDASFQKIGSFCNNAPSFQMSATLPNGKWSGLGISESGQVVPSSLPEGKHWIYHQIEDNVGCIARDSQELNVLPIPMVNVGPDLTICKGANKTVNATSNGMFFEWSPANGVSQTNSVKTDILTSVDRQYVLLARGINGCSNSDVLFVTVQALPKMELEQNIVGCEGTKQEVKLNSDASTFQWQPTNGLSNPRSQQPTISIDEERVYTVTGVSSNGCKDSAFLEVDAKPNPIVSAEDVSYCAGDGVQFFAAGATSYTWLPTNGLSNSSISNPIVSATESTQYTLVGSTDGCTGSAIINAEVKERPVLDYEPLYAACIGDDVAVLPNQTVLAQTFNWAPAQNLSSTTVQNPVFSAVEEGSELYTLTAIAENGCAASIEVAMAGNKLPVANAGADLVICEGDTIPLGAVPSEGTPIYSWEPSQLLDEAGIVAPNAFPSSTTTFTMTVFGGVGCQDQDVVTITVNELPTIETENIVKICPDQSWMLMASGADSYDWTPKVDIINDKTSAPIIRRTEAITYTVTGTNTTTSCKRSAEVQINFHPVNGITAKDVAVCAGSAAELGIESEYGIVSYNWLPAEDIDDNSISNPVANPTNSTVYTVTTISEYGCAEEHMLDVKLLELPSVSSTANATVCVNETQQLFGNGADSYFWQPADGLSSTTVAAPIFTPTVSGAKEYTLTGTNSATGCAQSITVNVQVLPLENVDAGVDTGFCPSSSVELRTQISPGYSSLTWTPTTGLSNSESANPKAAPAIVTTYTLRVRGSNGCVNTDEITVQPYTEVVLSGSEFEQTCPGIPVEMMVTSNVPMLKYEWQPNTGVTVKQLGMAEVMPSESLTYTVLGTSKEGCEAQRAISVVVLEQPHPTVITYDSIVCIDNEFEIGIEENRSDWMISWQPTNDLANPDQPRTIARPSRATTYTLSISNGICEEELIYNLSFYPEIDPLVQSANDVCEGASTLLLAAGLKNPMSVQWEPGNLVERPNAVLTEAFPEVGTLFSLKGKDQNGCAVEDEVYVEVHDLPTINVVGDFQVLEGQSVNLKASGGVDYVWYPKSQFDDFLASSQSFIPEINQDSPTGIDTFTYTVVGTDANDCTNETVFNLEVRQESSVAIPTAIRSNCTDEDCLFKVFPKGGFTPISMKIWNRWGQVVYSAQGSNLVWDGTLQGEQLAIGNYSYQLIGRLNTGRNKVFNGSVMLLR